MSKKQSNLKKILIAILVFCVIISPIFFYYIINLDNITMVNTSKKYVELYSKQLLNKKVLISEIDDTTEIVLSDQVFEKTFLLSNYNKEYFIEVVSRGKKAGDELKQSYFNELVMLRLKVLAVQGQTDDYNELFFAHVYDIVTNLHTSNQYVSSFVNDKNFIIEWNGDLYKIIENALVKATEDCEDNTTKFYLLNEIIRFYDCFDEDADNKEFYRKQLGELVKENKTELTEVINDKYEELNYKF